MEEARRRKAWFVAATIFLGMVVGAVAFSSQFAQADPPSVDDQVTPAVEDTAAPSVDGAGAAAGDAGSDGTAEGAAGKGTDENTDTPNPSSDTDAQGGAAGDPNAADDAEGEPVDGSETEADQSAPEVESNEAKSEGRVSSQAKMAAAKSAYDVTLPDDAGGDSWKLGNNGGQALAGKSILVKQEGQVTNGGTGFTATISGATFDSEKTTDATKKYAIVATNGSTINLDGVTFNAQNTGGIARGANASSVINVSGSTFDGTGVDRSGATGVFGNSNDKATVIFNFTGGTNTLTGFTNATIFGRTNVTGGTLAIENSTIAYDSSAPLNVNNGATLVVGGGSSLDCSELAVKAGGTLKLVGDAEVSGTVKLSASSTLDLTESDRYNSVADLEAGGSPFSFINQGVVKGIEFNVVDVYIYEGEKGIYDAEGNFTEDPTPSSPSTKIKGATVIVEQGTPVYTDDTNILVYGGGTLDASALGCTIDKVPSSLPGNVNFYKDSNLVLATLEIDEVVVNNNETATMEMDGEKIKITKDPNFGPQQRTITTAMVNVTAKEYTISDTAPVTVNRGGRLYFNGVTLDDGHAITTNSGGTAYLKGENHFGNADTEVAITNAGQILVHPDEASADIKDSNLKLSGAGNITVANGKTLTIDPTTITPVGNQQIIVESGATLIMEDTEVDLSQSSVRYIVLRDGATLNLKNCTFKNAPKLGVIRANGNNTINIEGCTFENNIANGGAYPQEYGGVIVVENASNVTIKDSTFTGNQASKLGGAIYQNGGTLNIEGTTFENNKAMTANGGAVYFEGNSLTVGDGCTFENNTAEKGYGGAVYSKAPLTVNAATFDQNSAKKGGAVFVAKGGDSSINDGATFTKNTSTSDGAAVCVYEDGSNMVGADSLTIGKATFKENKSTGGYGGAVYAGLIKKVDINGATFENNEALRGAATCLKDYNEANVNGATFTTNKAVSDENHSNQGGAIYSNFEHFVDGGTLNINGSTFTGNEAGTGEDGRIVPYGGAIALDSRISGGSRQAGATVNIGDLGGTPTTFTGNKVNGAGEFAGGAICIHEGSAVYMKDAAIYNNYADDAGAGIATCHIGTTQVNVFEGAAIFNNTVGGAESLPEAKEYQDVYEFFNDVDSTDSVLYERMFNGGLHMWKAQFLDNVSEWSGGYGTAVIAQSNPTNTDVSAARVVFTDNAAYRYPDSAGSNIASGGAISCNGELYIGTQAEIKIVKLWDDDTNARGYRPSAEEFLRNIHLFANDEEVDLAGDGIKVDVIEDAAEVVHNGNIIADDIEQVGKLETNGKKAWVIVVSGLPANDAEGSAITYTVKEDEIANYANMGITDDLVVTNKAVDDFTIAKVDENGDPLPGATFEIYGKPVVEVEESPTISISVAKIWETEESLDNDKIEELDQPVGDQGGSATINLLANGKVVGSLATGPQDAYVVKRFSGLPTFDENSNPITYTLEETGAPEGYDTYIQGSAAQGFAVVNTQYDYYTVDPAIASDDVANMALYVNLYGTDGTTRNTSLWEQPSVFGAAIITTGEETEVRIPKKVSLDGGTFTTELVTVKSTNDADWDASYDANKKDGDDGYKDILTHTVAKETPGTDIEEVAFDGGVKYVLTYPDTSTETVSTKTEADAKAAEWKLLYTGTTDETGIITLKDWAVKGDIKTVEVTPPDGYVVDAAETEANTTDKQITVRNYLRTTSVKVSKSWVDNENADGLRPDFITVTLWGDGEKVAEAKLDEANGWAHEFADLPRYKDDKVGQEIAYEVTEEQVSGYEKPVVSGDAANGFTVTNTREGTKYATAHIGAKKTMWDGSKPPAGFEFTLVPMGGVAGDPVPAMGATVQNDAEGAIDFGTFSYPVPAEGSVTYSYVVYESRVLDGYIADGLAYQVDVQVSSDGAAKVVYYTNDGQEPVFENYQNSHPNSVDVKTPVHLTATKTLDGKTPGEATFSFQVDKVSAEAPGTFPVVATSDASGNVAFPAEAFTFTKADVGNTYQYRITELSGEGDYVYDGRTYDLFMSVYQKAEPGKIDGELWVNYYIQQDGVDKTALVFENETANTPKVVVPIEGTKTLEGATLSAGQFNFTLDLVDCQLDGSDAEVVQAQQTATNGADGIVHFTETLYDPGTYTYEMKEVAGNEAGITYDSSVKTITVKVVQDGDNLVATVEGDQDEATFVNKKTGEPKTPGKKTDTPSSNPKASKSTARTGDADWAGLMLLVVASGVVLVAARRRCNR